MPIGVYPRKSVEERFWGKVDKRGEDECWEWKAGIGSTGRGIFHYDGKARHAPRISWILAKGKIPDGAFICHTCDNGKCVNPKHLFIGNALINNRDCYAKGRHPILRGENDPKSKLNNEKVLKIVEMYETGNYSQYQIAKMFNVSRSAILAILRGQSWAEITGIKKPLNVFLNNMDKHLKTLTKKYPPSYAIGENASRAKLTSQQVIEIRKHKNTNHRMKKELSKKYGVGISAIYAILENRTWRHLCQT